MPDGRFAVRFSDGLINEGYQVLNEVVLNQVLVKFGDAQQTRRIGIGDWLLLLGMLLGATIAAVGLYADQAPPQTGLTAELGLALVPADA